MPYNCNRERIVHVGSLFYTKEEALEAKKSVNIPEPYVHDIVQGFEIKTFYNPARIIILPSDEQQLKWLNRVIATLRLGPRRFSSTSYAVIDFRFGNDFDFLVGIYNTVKKAKEALGEREGRIMQMCYLTTRREIECAESKEAPDLFDLERKY